MKTRTILILLILTFSVYVLNINIQSAVEENDYRPASLELTSHDPISITSDSDFKVFPGTGTPEDPYLIEGYSITTTSNRGIYIRWTTKYFIVRNCYIDAEEYGIQIDDVAVGTATVINNTCSDNSIGICLWGSISSTIVNNTCSYNNAWGIYLSSSGSSNVINNTCNYNNYRGIYLSSSGNSTVTNNMCSNNNQGGIELKDSDSSTVTNNTCNNGRYGIYLEDSSSSTVISNTFTNCGLYINERAVDASLSYTVENNWVNDKILGFYTNLDSIIISEPVYGQLVLINCTNVTVRDQILNNATIGLFLHSCKYSVIINNTCNNNDWGIYLCSSYSCVVTYNLLQENIYIGVCLNLDSDNNLIHHNTFVDNNLGGTSQAWDGGANNTWYDTATQEGNYWSDWSGIGTYSIDGHVNSVDLYPLEEPMVVEYPQIVLLTLILSIVPLFLTRIISKKSKKE